MIKVKSLRLKKLISNQFQVEADLHINFKSEEVAINESYYIVTVAIYSGEV